MSVNDAFNIYGQFKFKVKKGVDKRELGAKIEKCFNDIHEKRFVSGGTDKDEWRVKCVPEGEYLCIGKHVILPHKEADKKF